MSAHAIGRLRLRIRRRRRPRLPPVGRWIVFWCVFAGVRCLGAFAEDGDVGALVAAFGCAFVIYGQVRTLDDMVSALLSSIAGFGLMLAALALSLVGV